MRFFIALVIFSFIIILSCKIPGEKREFLTRDNLPSKEYTINSDRDTTLQTEHGALLKIPRGALKPESGNTVTLEIKEAYSLSEMVKSGLVTQSNGQPLSSGGMIYINAAAGQKVTITQAIKVAIPAGYLQKGMQLYKGDSSDRKINWTNPTALPENGQLTSIDRGQVLFQQNCSSCHSIEKDMTGPKLAHFPKRFGGLTWGAEGLSSYWYHGFPEPVNTERPVAADTLVHKKDSSAKNAFYDPDYKKLELYVCNLIQMYRSKGTAFNFNRQEFIDLFKYIQNESDRMDMPLPGKEDLKNSIDSCVIYRKKINHLLNKKEKAQSKRNNLIEDNGPLVDKNPDTTWIVNNNAPLPLDFDKRVSPNNYDAVYYQFTIESFGWYNIDMLLKDVNGVEESELFVRVVGQYKKKIKIFLIIPSVKVYGEGGPAEKNPEEFAFFYKNGKLPLPQNATAYVLAVTETEQSIAFGIKKFTTGKQQEFDISLHTSSKEEFMSAMSEFDMGRLHIKVDNAKNADEIRKTDAALKKIDDDLKNIEKLKPKRCDCDCGEPTQK